MGDGLAYAKNLHQPILRLKRGFMTHKPIHVKNLSLYFPHKICFENFNAQIGYGRRIAIIGRNGCGKSTLLKILQGTAEASAGGIQHSDDINWAYVPQVIDEYDSLSGGARLNKALAAALCGDPNVLLLDEPTNHLDRQHRHRLMRMLRNFYGTLLVVSHDTELLRHSVDTLWHIDHGAIHEFRGCYDDYIREAKRQRAAIAQELSRLDREKKDMHHALMQEQQRAAKSRVRGEKNIDQRKWPTITSKSKALRAAETPGRKKMAIEHQKQDLMTQLENLRLPEIIVPTFSLNAADNAHHTLLAIREGSVGYVAQPSLVHDIYLSLNSNAHVAIMGSNGSGKTTLIKAILGSAHVIKTGDWVVPKLSDIGYLDQHYATLIPEQSVLDSIATVVPNWSHAEIRHHLNTFLFHKNEAVHALTRQLSGGEKARLSLAQIAARTPKLLILDEVSNNLDLETRTHVIEVLKGYPGAMIVVSHDEDFLQEIAIDVRYQICDQTILKLS